MAATLCKEERLSSKAAIDTLVHKGRWSSAEHVRCCHYGDNGLEINRILVSVPKKFFKRAVKRNLLKRRMREAYRTQKDLLPTGGHDIMFVYGSASVATYLEIRSEIANLLQKLAK